MATATKNAPKTTKKQAGSKAAPAKKDNGGLRKPQLRILAFLAKAKSPAPRTLIAEKAPVDQAACVEYIGSHDEAVRKANDAKHFPSLVTLGLVRAERHDEDGKDVVVYSITAKGRQALEKATK